MLVSTRRWRRIVLVAAVAVLAACGTGSEPSTTPAPETSAVLPPATTPTTSAPTTTGRSDPAATTVPADSAPDFSLDLGSGGTFVLSEEARPVFMVFWAEW
jgi:hypothetical protein